MRELMIARRVVLAAALLPCAVGAQGTAADYARAEALGRTTQGLMVNVAEAPVWIRGTNKFWYRKSVKGGNEFVLVDADQAAKGPAFDHAKLAAALSTANNASYTAITLPFTTLTAIGGDSVTFVIGGFNWKCTLSSYQCTNKGAIPADSLGGGRGGRGRGGAGGGRGGGRGDVPEANVPPREQDVDVLGEPIPYEGPWDDDATPPQQANNGFNGCLPQNGGGRGAALGGGGGGGGRGLAAVASDTVPCISKDGTMAAFIENYNVFIRPVANMGRGAGGGGRGGRGGGGGGRGAGGRANGAGGPPPAAAWQLSWDGSEGSAYTRASIRWSPKGNRLVAVRLTPGYARYVHYVLSSPPDQLQPTSAELYYQKPGDVVALREPAMFDVAAKKEMKIDNATFPNAYNLGQPAWWEDGRAITFEYNQRGHQVYRVIEADTLGRARILIDEESKTFIDYSAAADQLSQDGRRLRRDLYDGKEIVWLSERDGWAHLYLYDGMTGRLKNQITKGNWRVHNVQMVDTANRQIYFSATAMHPDQDPYFIHYYRINFDGTGLVAYTSENGTHTVSWSSDKADAAYYVDTWQTVDMPPVSVLKRASDQKMVLELEKGDASALLATGWKPPEVFVAKGRDGTTDIWGIIVKPSNFDPSKKYPVIEQIYAGPQGSFVPKTWSVTGATRALAEIGFIVVQVDGMGTANRSRAFHDVAYQNLGDAGFPDRILWHKAIAAKYPWYDISRVGIYGTSAGGQNALGGMLFHPEFYKVAFSAAGCHDNRMDKIWWNEQWMGWPIGPAYAASSNVDNAYKLQGKLLLVVGEHDTNVDPSSTMQVVNALIKANKEFDLLVIPGADHTNGGPYGVRKMTDFFVHNLLGVEPPVRNASAAPAPQPGSRGE